MTEHKEKAQGEEQPYIIYDGKPLFQSDWVVSNMSAQSCRIDRAEYFAWGAMALSVLAIILALVL